MIKKVKQIYNSLNLQVKVILWFTVSEFIYKAISLLTTPIFTRILTTEEYGIFSVYIAWSSIFCVIATLNLHMGVAYNALVKFPKEKEKVISVFQSFALIVALLFAVLGIVFRDRLAVIVGLPEILIIVMFLGFIFIEPYQLWAIYKRYEYDYKKPVLVAVIISVLTPVISIASIMLIQGDKGIIRTVSYAVVNTILPGIIFYIINWNKSKAFYHKNLWKYAITFNGPLLIHYLAVILLNQTDRIMINWFYGSREAGIYSIASSAASIVLIFATAVNAAFVPWQYQCLKSKKYKSLSEAGYLVLAMIALMLFAFILFAPEIIEIFAGQDYMGAVGLIPLLGASVFFNYMYQLFSRVELYYEKKSYTVIATILATLTNIILDLILLPKMGFLAAGIATLIAHMVFCVTHYIFYRKICKDYMNSANIYDYRIILPISLFVLCLSFFLTFLYEFLLIRLFIVFLCLLLIFIFRKKLYAMVHSLLFVK